MTRLRNEGELVSRGKTCHFDHVPYPGIPKDNRIGLSIAVAQLKK